MPQSIPPGLTRDYVLRALGDLDAKVDHPFGQPTGYELVYEGKRYAPKAVIGLASRRWFLNTSIALAGARAATPTAATRKMSGQPIPAKIS